MTERAFSAAEADSEIASQPPFDKPVEKEMTYPIGTEESEAENTYLCSYQVVAPPEDYELQAAFQVLEYVLITAPGAPIRQAYY